MAPIPYASFTQTFYGWNERWSSVAPLVIKPPVDAKLNQGIDNLCCVLRLKLGYKQSDDFLPAFVFGMVANERFTRGINLKVALLLDAPEYLLRAKIFKEHSMDEPLESGTLLTKYVVTLLKHADRFATRCAALSRSDRKVSLNHVSLNRSICFRSKSSSVAGLKPLACWKKGRQSNPIIRDVTMTLLR